MSISGGGDDGRTGYSDHEIHHVRQGLNVLENQDAGNFAETNASQFEITQRGLDNDELAELVAFRVQYGVALGPVSSQTAPGTVRVEFGAGYNLQDEEFLQVGGTFTTEDIDSSGTDDIQTVEADTDEVGQIWAAQTGATLPIDDSTDGPGAGADVEFDNEMVDFRAMLGGGPILDATDDFTPRVRVDQNNAGVRVEAQAVYTLYYDVETMEGGRPRFGRL